MEPSVSVDPIIEAKPVVATRRGSRPRSLKRGLWRLLRYVWLIGANYPLRRLLATGYAPQFLFAIYGTERQAQAYYPAALSFMVPPVGIAGLVRVGKWRGFIVGTDILEHELMQDARKLRGYLEALGSAFESVRRISLVGRLPTMAAQAGIEVRDPFVAGAVGTRLLIREVGRAAREIPSYASESRIAILGGAGRIGGPAAIDLLPTFAEVVAFDPRYHEDALSQHENGTLLQTSNPARLRDCRVFIGLTRDGESIRTLLPHLPSGSLLIDDTHPPIDPALRAELHERGVTVRKAVLMHDEFTTWPRLPGWDRHHVPGCVVEALVLLAHETIDLDDLDAFAAVAIDLGFRAALERPIDE